MNKIALTVAAALVSFAVAVLGLVVLFSTLGATAQAAACESSTFQPPARAGAVAASTTTSLVSNSNCGAAASATLPSSSVVNNGLPTNYVIPADASAAGTVAITYALAQLGKSYLWGGTGPAAFDCSGLTMMAWAQAHVTLAHYTGDQINEGTAVLSYAEISPGDLVLVPGSDGSIVNPGHVGIYLGDGLVEAAVDVQFGVIVQSYVGFVSGGLSGIRHVG